LGQQQLVEIAKALSVNARVLILDEPTSSLSARETERLFEVMSELQGRGVSLIYISHRLAEIQRMADRVTVLRDGVNAGDLNRNGITTRRHGPAHGGARRLPGLSADSRSTRPGGP